MKLPHIIVLHFLLFGWVTISMMAETISTRFTTATAGIDFQHQNGATGDFHLPETIGSGLAWLDYDNDGFLDLYCVNSGYWQSPRKPSSTELGSRLYRNLGDGTFADVTNNTGVDNTDREMGAGQQPYGQGVTVADYDNDSDADLYLTNFGANRLYQNNGDGTFTDVTDNAGVGDRGWSSSATFLDIDLDGFLDLYVVNYLQYALDVPYLPCGEKGKLSYCHPSLFEGAADQLYRNNGDGTFTNVTDSAGITDPADLFHGKGLGVVAGDFNHDGGPDIYVANDDTPNFLFYNQGDGHFNEVALLTGCAYSFDGVAQAGMGVDVADLNGDGWLDIFVTNLSYETNALYFNNSDGTFNDVIYQAYLGNESLLYVGFGTGLYDFDNDSDVDLFIANGHVIHNIEQTSDVLTSAQPNQLFLNAGNGTFREVSKKAGEHFNQMRVSRGAAFGDYDNDGDIDIAVSNSNQPLELLRNETIGNWVRIKTVGTVSNRDGIGSRIKLKAGAYTTVQEVHFGSGYLSCHDPRLHFGLHQQPQVDQLQIEWLSGAVQVFENLPANQEIVVTEPKLEAQLLWGSKHGKLTPVEQALESGVSIDVIGRSGNSALIMAVEGNHQFILKLLLEQGANIDQQNQDGNTALILACSKTAVDLAQLLLDHQANVNLVNQQRETALMYAAWRGSLRLVEQLLMVGAEVGAKNADGQTAMALAKAAGQSQIVEMLGQAEKR